MTLKRKSPMWPYLSILACLFAICLAAPRSWERVARRPKAGEQARIATTQQPEATNTADRLVVKQPSGSKQGVASASGSKPQLARSTDLQPDLAQPSNPKPDLAPSERVLVDRDGPGAAQQSPPSERPVYLGVRVTDSTDRLAMVPVRRPSRSRPQPQPENTQPQPENSQEQPEDSQDVSLQTSRPDRQDQPLPDWSVPTALLSQLEKLATRTPAYAWATGTAGQLRRLTSDRGVDAIDAVAILEDLRSLTAQAAELTPALDPPDQRLLGGAQQALLRRLDIWELVQTIRDQGLAITRPTAEDRALLSQRLAEVATLVGTSKDGEGWRGYLLLDQLEALARQDATTEPDDQRALARRLLVRLRRPRMSRDQRRFVSEGPIGSLRASLRRWAAESVDIAQVLANLERYEQSHLAADGEPLADDCRKLRWSAVPEFQELGRRLEGHYRAANMHVSISAELINRFMPKPQRVRAPVYDTILGADVEGDSLTTTQLAMRLLPADGKLRLVLEARGHVASDTTARSGPATFYSVGQTEFVAHKLIEVTPDGLTVSPAIANAAGQSDLMGVDTDYDYIPLVGSFVRSIATARHESSHDEAMVEVEGKVMDEARRRLDTEANRRIAEVEGKLTERVFGIFDKLSLNLTPLSLVTTDQLVQARVRLAGDRQLCVLSPHPAAPPESHLSVQLHLSAVNNAIDQLQLDGRRLTLPELYDVIADKLGRPGLTAPDDVPENVVVHFADHEAVRVSGIDGRIQITLAIDELKVRRSRFSGLTVRAYYRPNISGLHAELVRDGGIQIKSAKRLRGKAQIVVRGVFVKVFRRSRALTLLGERIAEDPRLADFEVTQFEVTDDWLALAVARRPSKSVEVANRPQ